MPIWCNALSFLNKLLGTALFFLSCFFLHASCSILHAPSTTSNSTHGRALTGPTLTVVNTYGQTADTHRLRFASPNPCPCIHDIAGAQQKHGIGLGPHKFAIVTCVWFAKAKPGATRDLTRAACERARQKGPIAADSPAPPMPRRLGTQGRRFQADVCGGSLDRR